VDTPRPNTDEAGFGLIELLIAMVVMNVGLLAIVTAFSSGAVSIKRAGNIATAASLADQQMEQYRFLTYDAIGLDTTAGTDTTYTADAAPTGPCVTGGATTCSNVTPSGANSCAGGGNVRVNFTNACLPTRVVDTASTPVSPDRHNYRVDTYIRAVPATATQRATKIVTVVVRDGSNLTARAFAREASTFDCSTGQVPGVAPC
jgi:Tfp pilus assembly protein PilV